ncbi:helix-turn-helix domain-containing protein [Plantactinospora endophytica]|uniref:AraC family transcriptional regulator n=1 Tax=Plantactinospora endophytica TaxID=673535 RepID=A0ABQ4DZ68_9ACTN|nr:helix-turn-helix domain-containing protein [Plantactinospora endophytica]GIG87731.1 AraC family transcriptional regulator [Plantactinospora endophytica]
MIDFEFNSTDLPGRDRFDYWRKLMSVSPSPMRAASDHSTAFRVHQHDIHLDALRVWRMAFEPVIFRRTTQLIRASDPETYNLCLLLDGTLGRIWDRREATYGPADLHTIDSSQPFELHGRGAGGLISCIGIEIPKKLVALPQERTDRLAGLRLPTKEGFGALLAGTLTQLTAAGIDSYLPSDGPRLRNILVELVSALFANALETADVLTPQTRPQAMTLRIRAFIQQHLHDPCLNTDAIAIAHHISTSYLHRLFQQDGTTLAAWIREQRLERARRDLTDPAFSTTPIHHIAARRGFSHAAAFSRVFRTRFGIAPSDYRQRALDTLARGGRGSPPDGVNPGAGRQPHGPDLWLRTTSGPVSMSAERPRCD